MRIFPLVEANKIKIEQANKRMKARRRKKKQIITSRTSFFIVTHYIQSGNENSRVWYGLWVLNVEVSVRDRFDHIDVIFVFPLRLFHEFASSHS